MKKEELAHTLMETLKKELNAIADLNKGWNKKIQFTFTDINIGYLIELEEDGSVKHIHKKPLEEGTFEFVDATVSLTVEGMNSIMKKEINPVMAMTQGWLQVDGDMSVLARLLPVLT